MCVDDIIIFINKARKKFKKYQEKIIYDTRVHISFVIFKETKYAPGVHKEEKMKINAFINCYSMSKTLRFKLAPEYETEKNLLERGFLDRDKLRADDYDLMKKVIE